MRGNAQVQRGIFRFAFRVNGSGAGLVIGVADANSSGVAPEEVKGWGLHLSHGALYTKRSGTRKGSLSTKQLVPAMAPELPEEDPEATFVENIFDIEVQVDMDRRRIAFGLPGGPLVEAPTKLSTSAVRPWAYLWNDVDSVMLDSRPPPREGMRGARIVNTLLVRPPPTAKPPMPLRSRSDAALLQPVPPSTLVRIPSHAERGDYLPPHTYLDRSPADARASARKSAREATLLLRSARHAVALAATRAGSPMALRASGGPGSPPLKLVQRESPSATATGDKVVGANEDGGTTEPLRAGLDDIPGTPPPARAADSASTPDTRGLSTGKSLAMSLRSARCRSPGSPRSPRSKGVPHMWDVVRYATGTYRDVHLQV